MSRHKAGSAAVPDFDSEQDIVVLDEERDILFSRKRWEEIARSIKLDEIPREMKEEIADFLVNSLTTSNAQRELRQRAAVKELVNSLKKFRTRLSEFQPELNSEEMVHQVKGLVEQIKIVQIAAETELTRTKKLGRPPKIQKTKIGHGLLDTYAKYTGKLIGLSRDQHNRPSGPCYRFLFTIFTAWNISTTGLARIIEQKRDMLKTPPQNHHG